MYGAGRKPIRRLVRCRTDIRPLQAWQDGAVVSAESRCHPRGRNAIHGGTRPMFVENSFARFVEWCFGQNLLERPFQRVLPGGCLARRL